MKRIILIFITFVFFLNFFKKEFVFYIPFDIPGRQMAITIPPFGMFIEKKYQNNKKQNKDILNHEKVHWLQYERYGLIKFYILYFDGYIKYGRINAPMEIEARKLSISHN